MAEKRHRRPSTRSRRRTSAQPEVQRILLATDGSKASRPATEWAMELADRLPAKVAVVTVFEPHFAFEYTMRGAARLYDREKAEAQSALHAAVDRLRQEGVQATGTLETGVTWRRIVSVARRRKADLIVVGSHGRGAVGRAFIGSVSDAVKNHSPVSVLIAKRGPPPRHVLAAVDGSDASLRAAAMGRLIGQAFSARGTLLRVVPPLAFTAGHDFVSQFRSKHAASLVPDWKEEGFPAEVDIGRPAEAILKAAKAKRAGLIVVGSRGLGGVKGALLGSTSNAVAHQADASVLIVK